MKILQFITELTPAGAERIVCELSKALTIRKHEVLVLSLMPLPANCSIVEELRDSQIKILSLNVTKFTPWRICGIRKIIKNFKPDLLHSHLIHPNIIARFASIANFTKFKLINTVHIAERRPGKWWHFFCDRITFSLCDCQTAVSKAVRDFHSAKIAKSKEDIPVIYNGVEIPHQLSEQAIKTLRSEWGVANSTKVIGSVGRLDWQKGYDIFLNHLSVISAKIPKNETWGIIIIGEGKYRSELENIINTKKYENLKVVLTGFRKDAADCIGAFDLFIMPSRYEGFGLTLIEAMMQGVPILANNIDSLPELMQYYSNGKCIDFENLTELINSLFNNINNQKIKPFHKFTIQKMVDEYLKLYSA